MTDIKDCKDTYLSAFSRTHGGSGGKVDAWVQKIRKDGIARFEERGFPTTRQEEWRHTDVTPIARVPFEMASGEDPGPLDQAGIHEIFHGAVNHCRLVFVDGRFHPASSSLPPLPDGVVVGSLAEAICKTPDLVEPHLAKEIDLDQPFAALNTAFLADGAFVWIPPGVTVPQPLFLLFVTSRGSTPTVTYPRCLVVAAPGSQVTVVEAYGGIKTGVHLTCAVTEIVAREGAVVDHYKLQEECVETFHMAAIQARQERNSTLSSHSISLGGGIVRNDLGSLLDGEGIDCTLNGLYLARGRQHVDNHTTIDHARPHSQSRELYKGVLAGRATAVFNGRVLVREDAQKTNAKQTNKNLLLSEDCLVNTKPELEIYADDVKCAHGATIGQLDEDALFYLRCRGIDREAARSVLTYAFAGEVLGGIQVDSIRTRLECQLMMRLDGGQEAGAVQ